MTTITTDDRTQIYYKDWGSGEPVVFSHGWPLNADSWEAQMLYLASNGYRAIAHDRRGHGRSSQAWDGNEMDTYADDLAALIETLDLRGVVLVGFSTGGGEVARYVGRHGTERVAGVALVSAVPPFMLETDDNPGGVALEVFEDQLLSLLDPLRLEGVVAAAVSRPALGVVPLEARATPPLAPFGEPVEVRRRSVGGATRTPARRLLHVRVHDEVALRRTCWRRRVHSAGPDAHG